MELIKSDSEDIHNVKKKRNFPTMQPKMNHCFHKKH